MSQLGVFLARQELRVVFDNFDQNKDGNIAYNEFVNVLKVSVLIFKSCAGLLSFLVNLKPLILFKSKYSKQSTVISLYRC